MGDLIRGDEISLGAAELSSPRNVIQPKWRFLQHDTCHKSIKINLICRQYTSLDGSGYQLLNEAIKKMTSSGKSVKEN